MTRRLRGALLLLFCLSFVTESHAISSIRIDQARLVLKTTPGQKITTQIRVENPSEAPVRVRVYQEDWIYKTTGLGDKNFFPPGTLDKSASGWLSFQPVEFTLEPQGQQIVQLTVSVPTDKDLRGVYYSVLFFEGAIGIATKSDGANVLVSGRLGTLIYVEIEGTVIRSGEITSLSIEPPSGNKPLAIDTEFANTGNTAIALEGNFVILSPDGTVKGRGDLTPVYTQEKMTVPGRTEWAGRLEKGPYELIATFDLGENQIIVREERFEVP